MAISVVETALAAANDKMTEKAALIIPLVALLIVTEVPCKKSLCTEWSFLT